MSVIVHNRKVRFDYFVIDELIAGIVLHGCEIKSIREHNCAIDGSYASIDKDELWLIGMHIDPYMGQDVNPLRKRKLLVNKNELRQLKTNLQQEGLTLVPLEILLVNGRAKVKLALVKGKKKHDKRQSIKERDDHREIRNHR